VQGSALSAQGQHGPGGGTGPLTGCPLLNGSSNGRPGECPSAEYVTVLPLREQPMPRLLAAQVGETLVHSIGCWLL
jgi:hypothetical protein